MAGRSNLTAAVLALTLASPAAAVELATHGPTRTIEASSNQLLVLTDQLIKRGERVQAERILNVLMRDPSSEVRNEARYRQSLLWEEDGETKQAAVLLRNILDERPKAAAVRLKLATLLHKMGDQESALRELRALHSANLPATVARFVDRISASLQASKPFGVQVEFSLAPDSNINRATQSDTFVTNIGDFSFDENAKRRSGVGFAARGLAHQRVQLSRDVAMVARASSDLGLYRDKRFNDISAELSIGPEFKLAGTRFAAEVALGERWYGMKPYQQQLRISGSASRPLNSVSQGRIDLSFRRSDNKVNDLQDGRGLTLRARYERALSPRLSLSGSVTTDRFVARDDAYSTRSWGAGLHAYYDVGRVTFNFGGEIGRLRADDRLAILPEAREDKLTRFSIGAVVRQFTFNGFAPMSRVTIERNHSNIPFYDYKRIRTEVGISRAF